MSPATTAQHMQALERANAIRLEQARIKRRLFAREITVAEILDPEGEIPAAARSMPIHKLLKAQHRWGDQRARRFLVEMQIGWTRRLDALTERERWRIVKALRPAEAVAA